MRLPATTSRQAKRAFAASVEGLPLAIAAAKAFQQNGMRSVADEIAQTDWPPTMLVEVIDGATQGSWNSDDMNLAFHMMARKFFHNDVHAEADVMKAISDKALGFATSLIESCPGPEYSTYAHGLAALTLAILTFVTKNSLTPDLRLKLATLSEVIDPEALGDSFVVQALALLSDTRG